MNSMERNSNFGRIITRLIQKESLSRQEARHAFTMVLKDEVTEMQQGAFLAALTAKGETGEEVAGAWEAIYELDTEKVPLDGQGPVVENSGTGMDSFKTFNISTAASLIAASGGVKMARHGARAITSKCGTVDLAEALGVDVECTAGVVAESIGRSGVGLFNGMSPLIHPNALGRILSRIRFGSTLNIAASLANPAMPRMGVRGVYAREMILPVAGVMKAIGYKRALVMYGEVDDSDMGMDEASVCGTTHCAELTETGQIVTYSFRPSDLGMDTHDPSGLVPSDDLSQEARSFTSLLQARLKGARADAAVLNGGLIFYVAGLSDTIGGGARKASSILEGGGAFDTLRRWVIAQNRHPEEGRERLERLVRFHA